MDIILIAAITANGMIAHHSDEVIQWSRDLPLFKQQTMGYPLIMGSKTAHTLATELAGRENIVVHRDDDPEDILNQIKGDRVFVIGGGKTYTRFAHWLTHLYLTVHPLIIGQGIPLFPDLNRELELKFLKLNPVIPSEGIYQYQFKVLGKKTN